LSLVLDWVDGSGGDPVDGGWELGGVEISGLQIGEVSWHLESVHSLGLERGVGGELVVSDDERVLGGVDLLDLGVLLGEEVHSELELLLGSVVEAEGVDVLNELLLHLNGGWGLAREDAEVGGGSAEHVHGKKLFGYLKLINFMNIFNINLGKNLYLIEKIICIIYDI
jgi:hypothetical protein